VKDSRDVRRSGLLTPVYRFITDNGNHSFCYTDWYDDDDDYYYYYYYEKGAWF